MIFPFLYPKLIFNKDGEMGKIFFSNVLSEKAIQTNSLVIQYSSSNNISSPIDEKRSLHKESEIREKFIDIISKI